jgi:hypothetical protein
MNVTIHCSAFALETIEYVSRHTRVVPEEELSATLDDILSSHSNHYRTTPADERMIVDVRIEFEPDQCRD